MEYLQWTTTLGRRYLVAARSSWQLQFLAPHCRPWVAATGCGDRSVALFQIQTTENYPCRPPGEIRGNQTFASKGGKINDRVSNTVSEPSTWWSLSLWWSSWDTTEQSRSAGRSAPIAPTYQQIFINELSKLWDFGAVRLQSFCVKQLGGDRTPYTVKTVQFAQRVSRNEITDNVKRFLVPRTAVQTQVTKR